MGALFSSKPHHEAPKSRVTEQDKAVLKLKNQRDRLKQYQKKIHVLLAREKELAKQVLAKGDRESAKLILRRKKCQEAMLVKTEGQLDNLEEMVSSIEFASLERQVVDGLEQGNEALKALKNELDIDRVERVMEDAAELQAWTDEVSDMLGAPLAQEDEDALLAEFDEMLGEDGLGETAEDLPALPTVPTSDPIAAAPTATEPSKTKKPEPELLPA
eukprot:m.14496 g.14496  ORF g.14496 m.14496 type:complete len:216 (+) comp10294_c0_seq1:44-691(+)